MLLDQQDWKEKKKNKKTIHFQIWSLGCTLNPEGVGTLAPDHGAFMGLVLTWIVTRNWKKKKKKKLQKKIQKQNSSKAMESNPDQGEIGSSEGTEAMC